MLWLVALLLLYVATACMAALAALRIPRKPVHDTPDWGKLRDLRVPVAGDAFLEAWLVGPASQPAVGLAVFVHGWGRNRDKMTSRARGLGKMGFLCILPSMRDHGGSTRYAWAGAPSFARDIEAVLAFCNEPVILYGHSAGAGGAVIAAARNPAKIRLLILEGCYTHTRRALLRLYATQIPLLGPVLGPGMLFWMEIFSRFKLGTCSPVRLAPNIRCPVLLIHGAKDEKFPLSWVWEMEHAFPAGFAEVCVAPDADHTSAGERPYVQAAVRAFVKRRLFGKVKT